LPHPVVPLLLAFLLPCPAALAQVEPSPGHLHHHPSPQAPGPSAQPSQIHDHAHDVGPAGATYDLRWLDAMVQHHTGALRMGEFVFDIGAPGVGALAKTIWRDQAQEIRAMGLWRKAWYPEAPVYPVVLKPGGDPNAMGDLVRMSPEQMEAMRMMGHPPRRDERVHWFLENMIDHHGGALQMAHDALRQSTNPTLRRLARDIIVAQRREILQLRQMLQHDGLDKPQYHRFDALFSL